MSEPEFDTERHIKYWQRCLKTVLPTSYTSTDSSRMTLGFFILSALDLLGAGSDTFPDNDRDKIRNWILQCQHPNGGFCGSPNHKFPDGYYVDTGHGRQLMDPANLPATFFAILSLTFVGSLDQVKRSECLRWLKTMQREDGSFGELVSQDGKIEGGRDMRYCYVATAIRWMLRGDAQMSECEREEDIDVEKLVNHIHSGQTYDGGFSESSQHEAHAGYTYCAVATLALLGRLPDLASISSLKIGTASTASEFPSPGLTDLPGTIRWLVSRQIRYDPEDDEDSDDGKNEPLALEQQRLALAGIYKDSLPPSAEPASLPALSHYDDHFVGFNGRSNKLVDTCYSFWVSASLDILGHAKLVNAGSLRRFLFQHTQHRIGGFGKAPGSPPDIYHSYLGLAALATMKEPQLKELDSPLCISVQQRAKIEKLRITVSVPTRTYWQNGHCYFIREDDPEFETRMSSSEQPPKNLTEALHMSKQEGKMKI